MNKQFVIVVFALIIAVIVSGCTNQMPMLNQPIINKSQADQIPYKTNSTFAERFESIINEWNTISNLHVVKTIDDYHIYIDQKLNVTRSPCTNKMEPVLNCSDVIISYQPLDSKELKAGDVVIFEITGNDSQIFNEKPFNGTMDIIRRIYRVGNDDGLYFIMKAEAQDVTHNAKVRFSQIRSKVIGFIIDASVVQNEFVPYTSDNRGVSNFNSVVEKWNNFVDMVYYGSIDGGYTFYYDKKLVVPSLACTGSMRPTMDCNDLIIAFVPENEFQLKKGDVISFRIAPNETSGYLGSSDQTIYVMHRIYRITTYQNRTAFITKGDNPDTNFVTDTIYLDFGRVELKMLGYFKDSFDDTFQ